MHKRVKARIVNLVLLFLIICGFLGFVLKNLNENISFYYTPTEILSANHNKLNHNKRLGGLVKADSLLFQENGLIEFVITDNKNDIKVKYRGILPDIFRENQGVVAIGVYNKKYFIAKKILAKHDENYVAVKLDNKD